MEDDDAIDGLDMINLGLGDVLLDTKTGYIYTPNTNTIVKMGVNGTGTVANEQTLTETDINTQATENTDTGEN
jgi:hypothetical protein